MKHADAQRALIALGYNLGRGGPSGNGDDDIWGWLSQTACAAFQRARGLAATGRLDPETIKALHAAAEDQRPAFVLRLLTPAVVRAVAPKARQDIVDELVSAADRFAVAGVTTKLRMAHFLSQACAETGALTALEESLNYSVEGLLKTFSRARISAVQCQALGRKSGRPAQQEQIANIVYGGEFGRKQLGNTEAGDGWRYRGGGILQITGRANYRRAGFEGNPEALRSPMGGLAAALKFWADNGLNQLADAGPVAPVRRRINGGTNGLHEAEAYFSKAKRALGI